MEAVIVDIGASKTDCLVISGNKCNRINFNTPATNDFERDIEILAKRFLLQKNADFAIVSFPGLIKNGTILKWPNKPYWEGQTIVGRLTQMFGTDSIVIMDDCNAGAMAALLIFPGCTSSLFVNVGTGIGSGIVLDGKLYSGDNGFAGEFGHTTVDFLSDDPCSCGRTGCLQLKASGKGMAHLYEKQMNCSTNGNEWMNQPLGKEILRSGAIYLGKSIANTVNLLDITHLHLSGSILKNNIFRDQVIVTYLEEEKKFLGRKISFEVTPDMNSSLLGASAIAMRKNKISDELKKQILIHFSREMEMN